MKIAFITFEYPPFILGGAGIYAKNITEELVRLGHKITVFAPLNNNIKIKKNLNVVSVPTHDNLPFKALQFWISLLPILKKEHSKTKFDLLHFNGISYGFLKKNLLNIPQTITIHHTNKDALDYNNVNILSKIMDFGSENSLLMQIIEKKCVKNVDHIIAVSKFTKKQICKHYNVKEASISVVYNGVTPYNFKFPSEELEKIKIKLDVVGKPIFLFVGRVDDARKDLKTILKSFANVLKEVDAILLVVGAGNQRKARKLVDSLNISDNVIFTGFLNEKMLRMYYKLCDVYVCYSKLEGFGLTVLDAMAAGTFVVAPNAGAIPEVLKDYKYKILVEPENPELLSESLIKSLKRISLLTNENKFVGTTFNWGTSAESLSNIFKNITSNKKIIQ